MTEDYIRRTDYTDKVLPWVGKNIIKVFVGQRRVGKSYVMLQTRDMVRERARRMPVVFLNLELHENRHIVTYKDLLAEVGRKTPAAKKSAVFVDEIQEVEGFEKALRSLLASGRHDIYCTGSNAHLLSGELSTYLSGRCIEIDVHGLSFEEFCVFHGLKQDDSALDLYIRFGGLPWLKNVTLDENITRDYVASVMNGIVLKDVVKRHAIRNVAFLQRLVEYCADNIGGLLSANSISKFIKSQRIRTSPNVVLDYLSYLAQAMLIYRVPRAALRGRKIFDIGEKYYFEDLGIRNVLVGYTPADIGKILENLVYMHLRRQGYEIAVGWDREREVDFVADKSGRRLYVQVAYLLPDAATRDREFGNLLAIQDNHPKYVVSMDPAAGGNYKGIAHMHILPFLKNRLD